MLFVIGVLSWIIIASIILSGMYQDGRYFTSKLFAVMYLTQYITGIFFYKTKFLKYDKSENQYSITLLLYITSILISLILSGSSIIFMINGMNINIHSYYFNNGNNVGKIFLYIILALDKFYSYGIYLIKI